MLTWQILCFPIASNDGFCVTAAPFRRCAISTSTSSLTCSTDSKRLRFPWSRKFYKTQTIEVTLTKLPCGTRDYNSRFLRATYRVWRFLLFATFATNQKQSMLICWTARVSL
uniref:Uncharacterized protein n=1 Tax=Rhipicephalus pulchellus TaxID=72859 RepID=L7LXP9_RHIPC